MLRKLSYSQEHSGYFWVAPRINSLLGGKCYLAPAAVFENVLMRVWLGVEIAKSDGICAMHDSGRERQNMSAILI